MAENIPFSLSIKWPVLLGFDYKRNRKNKEGK